MLGNKRGNSGYDFVLKTNTYGCWYYPDDHHNKNYAKSAFWGAASSEAEMKDPNPGAAHHVRLICNGGGSELPTEAAGGEEELNQKGYSISEVRHAICKTKARETCYGEVNKEWRSQGGQARGSPQLRSANCASHDAVMSGQEHKYNTGAYAAYAGSGEVYAEVYGSCSEMIAEDVKKHHYWK